AMLVAYACLLASSAACFLYALVLRERNTSLPYSPALYLFPVGVVEATSAKLRLHSLLALESAQSKGSVLRLLFEGGKTFEFALSSSADAAQAKLLVLEAKKNLSNADQSQNPRALALLDPLRDNGFSSVFSPTTAFKRTPPTWVRVWPIFALAV